MQCMMERTGRELVDLQVGMGRARTAARLGVCRTAYADRCALYGSVILLVAGHLGDPFEAAELAADALERAAARSRAMSDPCPRRWCLLAACEAMPTAKAPTGSITFVVTGTALAALARLLQGGKSGGGAL